ncbi:TPA: toprim domain-containing protein [Legionella pneumophila]|nr:hypothetical protein [Legionella pneumophila]HAW6255868.1 hypothetical protein [Legionella pneumophila]HBD7200254.1 toprim domain-containing protein [Legionella pneumophila]HBD9373091.1 toprim domain-containing protein [Legionella pneumophila]HEB4790349.1 toprim domain-containing protein [Legionella pneumophila]
MQKFLLHLSEVIGMGKTTTPEINQLNKYIIDKKSIKLANDLWVRSVPLKDTPAEKYIVGTRKIPAVVAEKLQIRSLKGPIGIPEFDKNKPYKDYVVVPVYNLDEELVGLQIIQIDPAGNKATNPENSDFFCKKYLGPTKPLREGKAAVINKTDNVNVVFIAEGVETAASVASLHEVRNNYSVLASMGVSELPATLAYVKTHYPPGATVVLLKDHDDPVGNPLATLEFVKAYQAFMDAGYRVIVKEPPTVNEDWNDVLAKGGVSDLERQINLNDPILCLPDIPARNSMVTSHFKSLYVDLLKNEKLAEEQAIYGLLDKVIGQLINKLDKTQLSDDLHKTIKEIDEVVRTTEGVRTFLSETKNIPCQLRGLRRALKELKSLEDRRRDSLRDNEDIDFSADPQTNSNGDLFKAYSYVMRHCLKHLQSLNPGDIFDLEKHSQILGFFEGRLNDIDNEIKKIPKLIAEFSSDGEISRDDEVIIKQLKNKLKSLKIERRLYAQEFHEMKQQLRLLRSAHPKGNTPYAKYYEQFVEDANSTMMKGKTQTKTIREELTGVWANKKQELQECYKKRIEAARQNFVSERKKAIPPLIEYLEGVRAIVKKRSEEIDKKSLLPESRNYQVLYLQAMEELSQSEGVDKILQDWLNNLENFKTVSPLIYYSPKEGETVDVVELIDYDSEGEETLDELCKEIFVDKERLLETPMNERDNGKEKREGKEGDSDPHVGVSTKVLSGPSGLAEGLMQSIQPSSLKTSNPLLYSTIKDFSERLAVRLYKSFEVISPTSGERQEFDGLALRKKGLTIIERKTNDGTGPGLFQRNFCQQKIASKHDFVLKNVIAELKTQTSPEQFIDIKEPKPLSWYSEDFTPEMKERLVNAAKSTVIKALQNLTFEFNVNKPKAYSATDYRGLFFNRGLIPGGVSLRFSSLGKGNEEVAHQHMDKISEERTAKRESEIHFI